MVLDISAAIEELKPAKFVPVQEADDEECRIYVGNIPKELRPKGFKNLFMKFGEIVNFYYSPDNRWAFVAYASKAECEVAITRLNGVFGMRTQFWRNKEAEEEEMIEAIPFVPCEGDNEAEKKVTPFNLPTFAYEFPPLPITEEDYKHPEMMKFDPKKEFLLTHDMFWVKRLDREHQKTDKMEKRDNSGVEVFSHGEAADVKEFSVKNCSNCMTRKSIYRNGKCSVNCQPWELTAGFPESKSLVIVTAIFNPRELFLRSLAPAANKDYLKLMNEAQKLGKSAKYLSNPPKPHSMALTRRGKIFTRAFVVSHDASSSLSTVILVDFGEIKKIPWTELMEISAELAAQPRFVFRCNLKDVKALEYNNRLKDAISRSEGTMQIFWDDFDDESIPEVTLKAYNTGEIVNEQFRSLLRRTVSEITLETHSLNNLKETDITPSNNVEIIVLDNSRLDRGLITCAIYTQYIEFLHQWEVMQTQCENLGEKFVPLPQNMCLVRLDEDNKWHRAICESTNRHRILNIVLMDCGLSGSIHTSNSRKLPVDFDFPVAVKICKIEGLSDEMSEDRIAELKILLPQNKRLFAKELLDGEDFCKLTLYNI
ncbi:protein vreteno [Phlebotomus argentipes]|uniref:protein vreteno n=1 Tax=Phlebotomus argentipes TaxID=94469 RepID=UPI0028932011|nr:protein vreteno [Phlebotomus argentipes]